MKKIISEESLKEILTFYSDDKKELIKHQILVMEQTILDHLDKYSSNEEFQNAFDIILKKIIEGNFIN